MVEENIEAKIPDEIKDFVGLLTDHELKQSKALAIARFISKTGSPQVFENPQELSEFLARYPRDLAPIQRRRVLEQHFAERGVIVPEELLARAGLHPKDVLQAGKDEEFKKKKEAGRIWTVDTNGKGELTIRMIKDASEPGTTLEEAKEAVKAIGREVSGEESPFILDPESGWRLNPKARVTGVELMALDALRRAHESGTPVDPLEALSQAARRVQIFREALGSGATELPEWMRDPLQFQKAIQELSPKGDNDALKEVRDELAKLREDQYQSELKRRDEQNAELVTLIQGYRGENVRLRDELEKNRMATGKTAYDLLGDLVEKVPTREDARAMIMEVVGKGPKLLPRGTREREVMPEGLAASLEQAAELKEVEDWWFKLGGEPTIYTTPTPVKKSPPAQEPPAPLPFYE